MFAITLRDREERIIESISEERNGEIFLDKNEEEYPLLSNLDEVSYDVFADRHRSQLVRECLKLDNETNSTILKIHINKVIFLISRLNENPGGNVTFSPFKSVILAHPEMAD